jgi:hypothetical protein
MSATDPVTSAESYQKALEFMKTATAKAGIKYDWVLDYAKEYWDYRRKVLENLDEKSDSIIKYLGGGIGLTALGILGKIDDKNAYLVVWLLPSLITALAAIVLAAWARSPRPVSGLPRIEDAVLHYAEKEGTLGDSPEVREEKAKVAFLGQWELSCERIRLVALQKAQTIRQATFCYVLALGLLLLPVVAGMLNNREAIAWPF